MKTETLGKMGKFLILAASVIMAAGFFFPLWKIDLWAPQYPEGLRMWIGVSQVTGDLGQINILNHYIGMQKIIPSSIPELHFMPMILIGLILIGAASAFINRRWAFITWLVIFLAVGVVGLYDFHLWNYNFGHNLSPDAPIKVPGMAYTPPVFGQKSLLNIVVYSYPDWGGIALFTGFFLGLIAVYFGGKRKLGVVRHFEKFAAVLALFMLPLIFSGCDAKPVALQLGVDACETCKMTISDARFGAEVITDKGRIYKFDSLPCMLKFYALNKAVVKSVWVEDFLKPGTLIAAESAKFLRADEKEHRIDGPMGPALLAAATDEEIKTLESNLKSMGGQFGWNALLASSP